jgi:beta-glucanase (GH16 family)
VKIVNNHIIAFLFLFFSVFFGYAQDFPLQFDCYNSSIRNPDFVNYNYQLPFVLVFEDNFDIHTLDMSKWQAKHGVPRDCIHKREKAWHTSSNIVLNNGLLNIITKNEKIKGDSAKTWCRDSLGKSAYKWFYSDNFDYTSAEIWTKQKFLYGKFEAKIKIPKGKGFWPAFWLWTGKPAYNEIDIFEFWNEPKTNAEKYNPDLLSKVHNMAVHYDYGSGRKVCTAKYQSIDFSKDFYIFTLIWEPDKIEWFVDGVKVAKLNRYYNIFNKPKEYPYPTNWIFKREREFFPKDSMYLILNIAIQSNEHSPDENTVFPAQMQVEYVRVYQREHFATVQQ